jgi:hypothetical protein
MYFKVADATGSSKEHRRSSPCVLSYRYFKPYAADVRVPLRVLEFKFGFANLLQWIAYKFFVPTHPVGIAHKELLELHFFPPHWRKTMLTISVPDPVRMQFVYRVRIRNENSDPFLRCIFVLSPICGVVVKEPGSEFALRILAVSRSTQ